MKLVIVWFGLVWAAAVSGHDGEDHSAPPPALARAVLPRASVSTGAFELVAVLEAPRLLIYLDQYASNEPVSQARVDVEGDGLKGQAIESSPGSYEIDAAALTASRHLLTFSIESGENLDLMSVTLDIPPPVPPAMQDQSRGTPLWIGMGGALLILMGAAFGRFYRKRKLPRVR